uniref:Aminopeptidase N n=1 Tax=Candidatus Kentrum sp. MB TaxID=2138164 RepID=A0A450X925_9GAMM|nr:MAG: aminopeptidase N [Candidatus Kentron sp. MB]VFK29742.1 MAG: aminopeptidase N [Candidatus Kentron sp. MB]VFK74893.1 MAG: aminopeptidase N [Candidatus Kentron sp. MB]
MSPKTIYRKDYTLPDYLIDEIILTFELDEEETMVSSRLVIHRNPKAVTHGAVPLILDGRGLRPDSVVLDGAPLDADDYVVDEERLTIPAVPERFTLAIVNRIRPQDNTTLEGLYRSSGNFCTQCEAEGFRRITYFADRPDVLAKYTTTIVANKTRYPVLLSNGNPARGESADGRHWVRWEDPFPKPCYLFALVAGDLVSLRDEFITRSGRKVGLALYVQRHNLDKCDHAMQSLKKAMAWDEAVFGLEYDLDEYMIVAVDDFNMGAMENKGLNIFNARYVLAKPETATDDDYAAIEEVIAHEYFHNWTGNRVTCRDWFQLSLKEGLTVFRDQEFSASQVARSVKRIRDVRLLRETQFSEDAGPMAHPVRPESYMEISNFYTVTIYEKGAEVIRMIRALLGNEGFLRGIALYLQRHDGEAATIEDFVAAMEEAGQMDLGQFRGWYAQAGTPEVSVEGQYDAEEKTYTLTLAQSCKPTPGQPEKAPFHIPIAVGLLDEHGEDLPLKPAGEVSSSRTRVLSLRQRRQQFRFVDIPSPPIPSLLRGFSAPVTLKMTRTPEELAFLLAHDSDPFSRWDAGQTLATRLMLDSIAEYQAGRVIKVDGILIDALGKVLKKALADTQSEKGLIAEILNLPTEIYLGMQMECVDVEAIHHVRQFMRRALAEALKEPFLDAYHRYGSHGPYQYSSESAGKRRLKNLCLGFLMELPDPEIPALCLARFEGADNMTDALAALSFLANADCAERQAALQGFERKWRHDPLVMDKWFAAQATSRLSDTLPAVKGLMTHPAFSLKNPNKVRALIGSFCQRNQLRFHRADGAGYIFLADQVLALDAMNPQIAARLLGALSRWRSFDADRQGVMKRELERIVTHPGLSRDTYEIASKTLA